MRSKGWRVVALVALGVAGLLAGAALWVRGTVPALGGSYPVAGLAQPVTVRFDGYARPFVEAASFEDALFAEGWLHASHRLLQMDLFRRAGLGRLSELFGASMLATDEELWRSGVPQLAASLAANASTPTRERIDAYVAGVNAALDAGVARAPEYLLLRQTPRRWVREDVFALGALMAFQSANNASQELLRFALQSELDPDRFAVFLPDDAAQPDFPYVIPPREKVGTSALAPLFRRLERIDPTAQPLLANLALGSNGWAVAPRRSQSGHALVAFDSHDALGLPNLTYEVHLSFAGRTLHGWSAPGLPGVITGSNDRVAWGFTNIGDTQDLFVETRAPDGSPRFRSGDAWRSAEIESVEIPVAGRAESERLALVRTHNGVLLSDDPPISLRWSGHAIGQLGLGIDALFSFNLARSADEFADALTSLPAPALAATFADVDGHIGFQTAGLFPLRGRGVGLVPQDGSDPEAGWRGFLPHDQLPQRRDPPEGFVATANARVQRLGEGPLISADNAPGYRIRRLQSVLGSDARFTVEDFRRLQLDWTDGQAELLLDAMLAPLRSEDFDATARAALAALRAWRPDPVAAPERAAPILFQAFYLALAKEVFEPGLGDVAFGELLQHNYPLNHALDRLLLREPDHVWWRGDRPGLLRAAFSRAVSEIAAVQGQDVSRWRLDRMHAVRLEHEFGRAVPALGWLFHARPAPWGGSVSTVGRARYRYDQAYDVRGGATVRFVAEMHPDGPRVAAVIPGGQSGHPSSPHYLDQFPHWLAGELLPVEVPGERAEAAMLTLIPR